MGKINLTHRNEAEFPSTDYGSPRYQTIKSFFKFKET